MRYTLSLLVCASLLSSPVVFAHGGRTDSSDCHNKTVNNTRHCHDENRNEILVDAANEPIVVVADRPTTTTVATPRIRQPRAVAPATTSKMVVSNTFPRSRTRTRTTTRNPNANSCDGRVSAYVRQDGVRVAGFARTCPNNTETDNYSFRQPGQRIVRSIAAPTDETPSATEATPTHQVRPPLSRMTVHRVQPSSTTTEVLHDNDQVIPAHATAADNRWGFVCDTGFRAKKDLRTRTWQCATVF